MNLSTNPFFTHGIDKLCTICHLILKDTESTHSIFSTFDELESPMNVLQVLQSFSNFNFYNCPQMVCPTCYEKIIDVYKFIQMCNKASESMQHYLTNVEPFNTIKDETIVDVKIEESIAPTRIMIDGQNFLEEIENEKISKFDELGMVISGTEIKIEERILKEEMETEETSNNEEITISHTEIVTEDPLKDHETDVLCLECQEVFNNDKQLEIHMRSHKKQFLCNDCGKVFTTKSGLKTHIHGKMAKREYNKWSKENMVAAIQNYTNGTLKFNEVCHKYSIPKPTFRRHLKGLNKHERIGRPNYLTAEIEKELVQHVLLLESHFFSLTTRDLRHLAFRLSEKYKLPHRFNKVQELASRKWYYKFMTNHPELSLRVPESTSIARCKGFNKQVVSQFFDKYEQILDNFKFSPNQIFNMDETGLNTVQKPSKILALKGKHQVGTVTRGERGLNTTCICCMNAAGEFIPPMLIFKRKRLTDELKRGGPPNTLYTCSESDCIVATLFVEWLQHFIKYLKLEKLPSGQQILLVLDGHTTHTKNLDAINLAKEYGIIMLSFPAHTTHKLQPLDRSFFKSLKHHFKQESSTWMRNHPSSVIKQTNISEILGIAYRQAACMATAINGFESCGLWPCNRHKLRDEEYVILEDEQSANISVQPIESGSSTSDVSLDVNNPSTSSIRSDIENMSPISTVPAKKFKGTTGANVLTATPYKMELQNEMIKTRNKVKRKLEFCSFTGS